MAEPKQPPERRTSTLLLRMTPSEREAIERLAADAGQSMSEYVLRAVGLRGPGKTTS